MASDENMTYQFIRAVGRLDLYDLALGRCILHGCIFHGLIVDVTD